MKRLPLYLLIDVSESMNDAVPTVQNALCKLMSAIECDPELIERTFISVITFSDKTEQIIPLTDILKFKLPELNTHGVGSNLGAALKFVTECVNREVIRSTPEISGDWKPFLFIFSNGRADDDLEEGIRMLQAIRWEYIFAFFPEKDANVDNLNKITACFRRPGLLYNLEFADEETFADCFFYPDDDDLSVEANWSKHDF